MGKKIKPLFIGREKELEWLKKATEDMNRASLVLGKAGIGKTSLLNAFINLEKEKFPGGIIYSSAHNFSKLNDLLESLKLNSLSKKTLIVLDDIEMLTSKHQKCLDSLFNSNNNFNLLAAGRYRPDFPILKTCELNLDSFSRSDISKLIESRSSLFNNSDFESFYKFTEGSPLLSSVALDILKKEKISWEKLQRSIVDFERSGILDPTGSPYTEEVEVPEKTIFTLKGVNEELIQAMKNNPEDMRMLDPRKFEEFVAEILARQGYKVELTPASNDGGFDVYAAKNDGFGSFLYLVECKRYTPPNKVGVQVIRSLHGVVQKEKATAGIIATTSYFTKRAEEFQQDVRHQMQLADYVRLQEWLGMI